MVATIYQIFRPHVPAMLEALAIAVIGMIALYYWRKNAAR